MIDTYRRREEMTAKNNKILEFLSNVKKKTFSFLSIAVLEHESRLKKKWQKGDNSWKEKKKEKENTVTLSEVREEEDEEKRGEGCGGSLLSTLLSLSLSLSLF